MVVDRAVLAYVRSKGNLSNHVFFLDYIGVRVETGLARPAGQVPPPTSCGYFGRFVNAGVLSAAGSGLAGTSGIVTCIFAGAVGFTPKSHTYKFMPSLPSISATAYSPGGSGSLGVTFTHPPVNLSAVVGIKFCSWLTLP